MAFTGLDASAKEDMIVSLATLVLHDGGKEMTADNINAVIAATGNNVQSYWAGLYASLLSGKDVDDLILKPAVGAPAAGAGAGAGAGAEAAAEEEDKKDESSSSSAGDGAANLFGGSDSDSDDSSS